MNTDVLHEEILKAIKQSKTYNSGGPDRKIHEFFVHGEQFLVLVLCNLFIKKFKSGDFPEERSEGYVISLHKKRKHV